MRKYKIIWSPNAYKDLQDIHFYIEHYLKELNVANKVITKILNSILSLEYLPEKYKKIKNFSGKNRNIQMMPVDKYIVIYDVNSNTRASFYFTYFS